MQHLWLVRLAGASLPSLVGTGSRDPVARPLTVVKTRRMSGELNLTVLLASMSPRLRPGVFVFASVPSQPDDVEAEATVREPEGLSVVVPRETADAAGWDYDFEAAWIILEVHSALHAVGLTAAVSTALADEGISCNVIAGRFYDHLLVPIDRSDDALAVLRRLSSREAASTGRG